MSHICDLRADLARAHAALDAHYAKYYFCKGYGTGWKGSHYGITQEEYDAAYARNTELRDRILRLMRAIERHKQPGRIRPSMVRV